MPARSRESRSSSKVVTPTSRTPQPRAPGGFSRLELLVVTGCLAALAALCLPALAGRTTPRSERVVCVNNLRQIGMALQMWAGDNGNAYPCTVPTSRDGTQGRAFAYEHFRVISNELASVQLLVCPSDDRTAATNFQGLFRNEAVSYFLGTDATPELFNTFLGGDRNTSGGRSGLCGRAGIIVITSYPPSVWATVGWSATNIHNGSGNVLLTDGRVEQTSSQTLGRLASRTLDNGLDNHALRPLVGTELP